MADTDKLIQAVKQAILVHHNHEPDAWTEAVDAILETLRNLSEPTEAQLTARFGGNCPIFGGRTYTPRETQYGIECYQAMIKARIGELELDLGRRGATGVGIEDTDPAPGASPPLHDSEDDGDG